MCEINIIIILIYQKLGLVGPVQQKIRLPLPYVSLINVKVTVSSEMKHEKTVSNNPVWCSCNMFKASKENKQY